MPLKVNLDKSAGKLRLCLEKEGLIEPPVVELCFDLDVSGSYEDEHCKGVTNLLMTRLVPWGLVFDPDKKLDVFTFSSGAGAAHYVGDVNERNYHNFVQQQIIGRVPGWKGGTEYVPVLYKNLELFGWIKPTTVAPAEKGWFASLKEGIFGAKPEGQPLTTKRKSLVLFNTDGENTDQRETERLFRDMAQRGDGMYVIFLAVSGSRNSFPFLEDLANRYSNVSTCVISDVASWVEQEDEDINAALIAPKLIEWFKA